jgi:predicted amidohydrolase YtcJ
MRTPAWRTAPDIYLGGSIHTMADGSAEGVIVDGDRIVFVGAEAEARNIAGADANVRDLAGACLLPGFVDAHTHPLMLGQSASWVDITGTTSMVELVEKLRRHADGLPPGAPIRGFGYEQDVLGRQPTADDLDQVSSDLPVTLMHRSGHGFVVNHAALTEAGIDDATPPPDGGLIGRGPSGRLDGRVFDSACDLLTGPDGVKITNHGPNFHLGDDPETLLAQLEAAQEIFLSAGITSVADMQVTAREMSSFLALHEQGRLKMRVSMMVLSSYPDQIEKLGLGRLGDDFLHLGGVKLYVDGSLSSGTAYMPTECCSDEEHLYHPPPIYTELLGRAHRLGLQTATHAQGPEAIHMVLDAVERAQNLWPGREMRHRIEHCAFPTDPDVARMKDLGVWPVPQPKQVIQFAAGIIKTYGPIGERMYPYGSFVRNGVPVVLSSAAPVTVPDPMMAVWSAVTRQLDGGEIVGPDERIDQASALAGYTINGAAAIHREDEVGSIEVGKLADFAVLDRDPFTATVDALPSISVTETIVGGRTCWPR